MLTFIARYWFWFILFYIILLLIILYFLGKSVMLPKDKFNYFNVFHYVYLYTIVIIIYLIIDPLIFSDRWNKLQRSTHISVIYIFLLFFIVSLYTSLIYKKIRNLPFLISGIICSIISIIGFFLYLLHFV
jgi:membrane-associated HD superfamily phosphohydrolase